MKRRSLAVAALAVVAVVAGAVSVCLLRSRAEPQAAAPLVVACDNGETVRFLPVSQAARIPLDFLLNGMSSPEEKARRSPVVMPLFWIADSMVTEGLFADVMGREVRSQFDRGQTCAGIEWEEAFDFCRRFTKRYAGQLPAETFASMPTVVEWAYAMDVLRRPSSFLESPVGAFIFFGNTEGGFLHTLGALGEPYSKKQERFDGTCEFATIGKREKRDIAGIRMVLVSWAGGQIVSGGEEHDNSHVTRGAVLLQHGMNDEARRMFETVRDRGGLSKNQRERVGRALAFEREHREYGIEDWGGLVKQSMDFAARRGFFTSSVAALWGYGSDKVMLVGEGGHDELLDYAAAGIRGKWIRIGDLPPTVRNGQSIGETHTIVRVAGDAENIDYVISEDTRVQTVVCDFSGDGRPDLVVEEFGNVGSAGYWYGFWEALPNGDYVQRKSVQVVGLCALASVDNGPCGFVVFEKVTNPVLSASLLTFKDGKEVVEDALPRPVVMFDAQFGGIYAHAPFIGQGHGAAWAYIEGLGGFYRPLLWVWEPCYVQGLPEEGDNASE